jgi:hypothetical protein
MAGDIDDEISVKKFCLNPAILENKLPAQHL